MTDTLGKRFVMVGQSMRAEDVELVAATRPERAAGLVLVLVKPVPLKPVPLAGTRRCQMK